MTVTLTVSYRDTLKADTVAYIDELCGDNGEYGLPCALEFIDEYGEDNFLNHYEDYVEAGETHGYEPVDAWVTENGFDDVTELSDFFYGEFANGEEVAMQIADEEGVYVPDFISVDWEETWDNLRSDFIEIDYEGKTFFYKRWH
jgi:hypothetical protein